MWDVEGLLCHPVREVLVVRGVERMEAAACGKVHGGLTYHVRTVPPPAGEGAATAVP